MPCKEINRKATPEPKPYHVFDLPSDTPFRANTGSAGYRNAEGAVVFSVRGNVFFHRNDTLAKRHDWSENPVVENEIDVRLYRG